MSKIHPPWLCAWKRTKASPTNRAIVVAIVLLVEVGWRGNSVSCIGILRCVSHSIQLRVAGGCLYFYSVSFRRVLYSHPPDPHKLIGLMSILGHSHSYNEGPISE